MRSNILTPEEMLEAAINSVAASDDVHVALDELPAAIYVTDQNGVIIHYNSACVRLAGRTPRLHHDKWCVTWKLYTSEGEFLPHDACPMAIAIRERRPVRGVEAIAERPDGSRVNFVPYPTPLFDADGNFAGAINMLIDVTERRQSHYLRVQAARCRRLAKTLDDSRTSATLQAMAAEYDQQATLIDRPN